MKIHGRTRNAVEEAISICKDRDVLKEYLSRREKEVVDIMMTLYDEEYIMRAYTKDVAREASIRGAIEMCQEIGLSVSEAIARIVSKYKLTEEDAEAKVRECWK